MLLYISAKARTTERYFRLPSGRVSTETSEVEASGIQAPAPLTYAIRSLQRNQGKPYYTER